MHLPLLVLVLVDSQPRVSSICRSPQRIGVFDVGDCQRIVEHVIRVVVVVVIPISVPAVNSGHGSIPLHMDGSVETAP
jgi:hypothetical protein